MIARQQTAMAGEINLIAYIKHRGNCFEACVASLMEVAVNKVPDLEKFGTKWREGLSAFLEFNGYKLAVDCYSPFELSGFEGEYIVTGPSPRGDWHHAVIHQKGELLFDPYPGGNGLGEGEYNYWKLEKISL